MTFDGTFWVAVSFVIFFGALIYFKIPKKINELLDNMITGIRKEIDESEKLRSETKNMLDEAQKKLDSADKEVNKMLKQTKDDSEKLVLEMNEKFHNSSEIKKNTAQQKINQMKENAIKDIKNTSIKIAVESVKKIISTSIDKSKLDKLFDKNLEETKAELKKINS
jgi:F-type H+-transporting ATPase subunit b|tara:strand:- start:60 stop:557 length:498 start_codon:yes stop_codon:yes gene_type:complete